MKIPKFRFPASKITRAKIVAMIAIALIFISSIALLATKTGILAQLGSKPNLLSLIGQLHDTTDEMLASTEQLHAQVQGVQAKLTELNAQEAVLNKQAETGQKLESALQTQVKLTEQGVELMRQILEREKVSVQTTNRLSVQSAQLAQDVGKTADSLTRMIAPLTRISQQSDSLNAQMDELLAELGKSKDSFKLLGNLNPLLKSLPLPNTGVLPPGVLPPGVLPPITNPLPQTPIDPGNGGLLPTLPLPNLPTP